MCSRTWTPPRVMRSLLVMRLPFTYQALLLMGPDSDARAPGAAITLELCGSWDHDPPCPMAAHHTRSQRDGDRLRVHVIFVCEPADETEVRRRIILALQAGPTPCPSPSHRPTPASTRNAAQPNTPLSTLSALPRQDLIHGRRTCSPPSRPVPPRWNQPNGYSTRAWRSATNRSWPPNVRAYRPKMLLPRPA